MELTLPWPSAYLSEKETLDPEMLAKLRFQFRMICAWVADRQGANTMHKEDRLKVTLTFVPPNRKPHSLDGALERMGSGLDGLADVIKVDPVQWEVTASMGEGIGGFVRVSVEKKTEESNP